jgi:hypothetical protein
MSLVIENLPEAIRNTKQQLRAELPEYNEDFHEVAPRCGDVWKKSSANGNPDAT